MLDARACHLQAVNDDVADEVNARSRDSFGEQVVHGVRGWRPQHVCQCVGDDPVDLFRHPAVERPQSRLQVRDLDPHLRGDQRRGYCRVHIAYDDHQMRPLLFEHLLVGHHDPGGLFRVAATADAEKDVWFGQAELREERGGHVGVVMLPVCTITGLAQGSSERAW